MEKDLKQFYDRPAVSALVTLSIGTKIKSEVKQFRDDKHLDNYLTFMVKKGYKVMGVTTNV